MPDPPQQTPPTTQYDQLLAGGLGQMQWTWQLELFTDGLDSLLDWMFPTTPTWVQPAYDRIMGFVDKIRLWFSSKLTGGHTYETEAEFRADFEAATIFAESQTGDSRDAILALLAAGPSEPQ